MSQVGVLKSFRWRLFAGVALAAGSALSLAANPAAAAGQAASPSPEESQVEEVVVTGSRVLTTYNSPAPVNVVGAERMQQLAIPDVATALKSSDVSDATRLALARFSSRSRQPPFRLSSCG